MKRVALLLICPLLFAGCDIQNKNIEGDAVVTFRVVDDNIGRYQSRGTLVENIEDINDLGAMISYGNRTIVQYSELEPIAGEDNKWSFQRGASLLRGCEFTCYAMSPYLQSGRGELEVDAQGDASFQYSLPSSAATAHKDILVARYSGQVAGMDETVIIPLHFEHPLSAIRFYTSSSFDDCTINTITLVGFSASAVCNVSQGVNNANLTFNWTGHSGNAEYTLNPDNTFLQDDIFIVIPQTLGLEAAVILDIEQDGIPRRFASSLNGISLLPGHLLTFTIGKNGEISIYADSIMDFTNESENIFE